MANIIISIICMLSLGSPSIDIVDKAMLVKKKYKSDCKYVVMVDYSKPIYAERLYVVNTEKKSIETASTVSHAFKSGMVYAKDFSNEENTLKSSLGAYLTEGTYYGKYGYSLTLKGLDNTNSNAKKRSIVFHSSKAMKTKWSHGCFALPDKASRKIIDMIKGGSLVYAYVD